MDKRQTKSAAGSPHFVYAARLLQVDLRDADVGVVYAARGRNGLALFALTGETAALKVGDEVDIEKRTGADLDVLLRKRSQVAQTTFNF